MLNTIHVDHIFASKGSYHSEVTYINGSISSYNSLSRLQCINWTKSFHDDADVILTGIKLDIKNNSDNILIAKLLSCHEAIPKLLDEYAFLVSITPVSGWTCFLMMKANKMDKIDLYEQYQNTCTTDTIMIIGLPIIETVETVETVEKVVIMRKKISFASDVKTTDGGNKLMPAKPKDVKTNDFKTNDNPANRHSKSKPMIKRDFIEGTAEGTISSDNRNKITQSSSPNLQGRENFSNTFDSKNLDYDVNEVEMQTPEETTASPMEEHKVSPTEEHNVNQSFQGANIPMFTIAPQTVINNTLVPSLPQGYPQNYPSVNQGQPHSGMPQTIGVQQCCFPIPFSAEQMSEAHLIEQMSEAQLIALKNIIDAKLAQIAHSRSIKAQQEKLEEEVELKAKTAPTPVAHSVTITGSHNSNYQTSDRNGLNSSLSHTINGGSYEKNNKSEEIKIPTFATKEEAFAAFKVMLEENKISADANMRIVTAACQNDGRWSALKNSCEIRQALSDYQLNCKKIEREIQRNKNKIVRDAFSAMLAENTHIHSRTPWRDVSLLLQYDNRFKNVIDDRDREELFDDYVLELNKQEAIHRNGAILKFKEEIETTHHQQIPPPTIVQKESKNMEVQEEFLSIEEFISQASNKSKKAEEKKNKKEEEKLEKKFKANVCRFLTTMVPKSCPVSNLTNPNFMSKHNIPSSVHDFIHDRGLIGLEEYCKRSNVFKYHVKGGFVDSEFTPPNSISISKDYKSEELPTSNLQSCSNKTKKKDASTTSKNSKRCYFHNQGLCEYGDKCRNLHLSPEQRRSRSTSRDRYPEQQRSRSRSRDRYPGQQRSRSRSWDRPDERQFFGSSRDGYNEERPSHGMTWEDRLHEPRSRSRSWDRPSDERQFNVMSRDGYPEERPSHDMSRDGYPEERSLHGLSRDGYPEERPSHGMTWNRPPPDERSLHDRPWSRLREERSRSRSRDRYPDNRPYRSISRDKYPENKKKSPSPAISNKNIEAPKNNNGLGSKPQSNFVNLKDLVSGKETRTNIQMRNIPSTYGYEDVKKEIASYKDKYKELRFPNDFATNLESNNCIMIFHKPEDIIDFYKKFENRTWSDSKASPKCSLHWGPEENNESSIVFFSIDSNSGETQTKKVVHETPVIPAVHEAPVIPIHNRVIDENVENDHVNAFIDKNKDTVKLGSIDEVKILLNNFLLTMPEQKCSVPGCRKIISTLASHYYQDVQNMNFPRGYCDRFPSLLKYKNTVLIGIVVHLDYITVGDGISPDVIPKKGMKFKRK